MIDKYKTPMEKINCLSIVSDILTAGYKKFRNEKASKEAIPGANELDPRFFYTFIKSVPEKMHSTLNYLTNFGMKISGFEECCLGLLKITIHFIENDLTPDCLKMNSEEFDKKVKEYAMRTNVSIIIFPKIKEE